MNNNTSFERLQPMITKYDQDGKPIEHKTGPENKQYLVLVVFKDEEEGKTFEVITGRSNVYQYIRECIEYVDVTKSYVLVNAEKVTLNEAITVYTFMKHMETYFDDESFNVDDYIEIEETGDGLFERDESQPTEHNIMMEEVREVKVGTSDKEDL